MRTAAEQRLRVTFGVEGALCYASVLDLGRAWERLLRRARLPLAYSQGFNPHPRMQFAAALPVGYRSSCEVVDLWLATRIAPPQAAQMMAIHAPPGLSVLRVEEAALDARSMQATIRAADYCVRLETQADAATVRAALSRLLDQGQIIRRRMKKGQWADYDLRPLILNLEYLQATGAAHELAMTLRCGQEGSGRPEEVVEALGLAVEDCVIHRSRLMAGEEEGEG